MIPALYGAFCFSGCSALIFEALWFRQAGNGLAVRLGDRIRRPLRLYACAEVVVALSGVVAFLEARARVVEHRADVPTSPFWTWLDGLCQVLPPS